MDFLLRALFGGLAVSLFAIVGDMLKPKSLAGTMSAAPAVALASVVLTVRKHGIPYATMEARSMVGGAIAFLVFASVVSWVQMRYKPKALLASFVLLPMWGLVAAALWAVWLRR